jgi:hypothetical protein
MDHDLTRLATLDPASGREPTEGEWFRSRARLEEAMATPFPVRRPRARRLAIGLAAVSALATGVALTIPTMLPDGNTAYASWTPLPEDLSGPDTIAAADTCARYVEGGRAAGEVVLAERRGISTLLIMWLREGPLIGCWSLGDGQPAGATLLADRPGTEPPLPPAGRINLDGGMGAAGDGDERYSQASGRVGPGVTGVDIVLPNGETVRATTRKGWWAAWWPGPEAAPGPGQVSMIRIVVRTVHGTQTYRQDQLY